MKMRKSKFKLFILISIIAFGVSGLSYVYLYKPDNVVVANAEFPYDITDKDLVVESAKNVFVGTVKLKNDVEKDEVGVYTPYDVTVNENIKGELPLNEEIKVGQRIGYDNSQKATIKLSNNDTYLEPGKSYVFSVRYDSENNIHRIIVPEYGNIKLSEDSSIKVKKIKEFKNSVSKKD